jgi:hypothetical protein
MIKCEMENLSNQGRSMLNLLKLRLEAFKDLHIDPIFTLGPEPS